MKAEEEEVDIDTIVTGAEAAVLSGLGRRTGPGTPNGQLGGSATPIAGGRESDMMDIDPKYFEDVVNLDAAWAEDDPDDDIPGGWRMKIIMDNPAADYY
jgi:COMPASS component SWD1